MRSEVDPVAPDGGDGPGPSRKGARTRQRLLDVAIEQFAAHGYRATAASRICQAAGMSTAAVYAYFPSKAALWRAALATDLDRLHERVRAARLDPSRPFAAAQLALVAALDLHPLTKRVLVEGTPDELRLVQAHPLFASTTALVAAGLRHRREIGELPVTADPDVLALGIETISFALLLTTLRAGLVGDPARVAGVLAVIHAAAGGPPSAPQPSVPKPAAPPPAAAQPATDTSGL